MNVGIGNHTNAELFQELKEQHIQFNQFALQLFEDQIIQTKQRGTDIVCIGNNAFGIKGSFWSNVG